MKSSLFPSDCLLYRNVGILGVLFLLGSCLCGTANNENKVRKLEHSSESKPQRIVMVPVRHRATLSSDFETASQAGGGLCCSEN